ncbi:MAG TPA: hypothetical protein PKB15_06485 [Acidimicrobiia bacterium]|nr:hypothetical protein [Acidimicrobiia bacterium]
MEDDTLEIVYDVSPKTKTMLILQASDEPEICEVDLIEKVADLYDLHVEIRNIADKYTKADFAKVNATGWDVVYICGHGNRFGVGKSNKVVIGWRQLSQLICMELANDSWFFLGCCRSGLTSVAYEMFAGCGNFSYVFGPVWKASAGQLACAFHTLMHNFRDEDLEPSRAAIRASEAINLEIRSYDREEIIFSDSFLRWAEENGVDINFHYEEPLREEDLDDASV